MAKAEEEEEDDAKRFRRRAAECRSLAAQAGNAEWRQSLLELAQDLENEADEIDLQRSSG